MWTLGKSLQTPTTKVCGRHGKSLRTWQPKFVNITAKVWHAATEAKKFHMFSLPHCCCYPEGLISNSQQRFWLQFYWFIMPSALPGCRFHVVVSTLLHKNWATKYWPTRSLGRCTENVLILYVGYSKSKEIRLKLSIFTWVTCKANEHEQTAEETLYLV